MCRAQKTGQQKQIQRRDTSNLQALDLTFLCMVGLVKKYVLENRVGKPVEFKLSMLTSERPSCLNEFSIILSVMF